MSRTPNHVLTVDFSYGEGGMYDRKTIPAGTFARPIELAYIPQHVLDDPRWQYFSKETEVFVYTRYGIIPVPRRILRET